MNEVRLTAGRVTEEVVLIDNTVHRPAKPNSRFVRALLAHLEECEFEAAPRYLGSDDQGREVFSFKPGDVPAELSANISDHALASAARLIRRFHDATAGTDIAASREVVCHNDLSPQSLTVCGSIAFASPNLSQRTSNSSTELTRLSS